jgi:hypothetical protein
LNNKYDQNQSVKSPEGLQQQISGIQSKKEIKSNISPGEIFTG